MSSSKKKLLHKLKGQIVDWAKKTNRLSNGWLWIIAMATQQTLKPNTAIMASAIAYFALFSLFPLTLLSISVASFSFGSSIDEHIVVKQLEFIAPALEQLLGDNINQIVHARGSVGGFALAGLLWSASSVFYTLTHTLNEIWHIPAKPSWRKRGAALLFVFLFIGPSLFLISIAGSVITNIRFWLPDQILPLRDAVSLILTLLLDTIFFMTLYMMLPHGKATWREVLAGAIGAALLWEFAKNMFLAFVSTYISISNLVYGTVAVIIAFLVWAYFSSLIFLFGSHLSVVYWSYRNKKISLS